MKNLGAHFLVVSLCDLVLTKYQQDQEQVPTVITNMRRWIPNLGYMLNSVNTLGPPNKTSNFLNSINGLGAVVSELQPAVNSGPPEVRISEPW